MPVDQPQDAAMLSLGNRLALERMGAGSVLYEVDGNFGLHKEEADGSLLSLEPVRKFRGHFRERRYFRIGVRQAITVLDDRGEGMWLPTITGIGKPKADNPNKEAALRSFIGKLRRNRRECCDTAHSAVLSFNPEPQPAIRTIEGYIDNWRDDGTLKATKIHGTVLLELSDAGRKTLEEMD